MFAFLVGRLVSLTWTVIVAAVVCFALADAGVDGGQAPLSDRILVWLDGLRDGGAGTTIADLAMLSLLAGLLAVLAAVPIGMAAALWRGGWGGRGIGLPVSLCLAVPHLLLALAYAAVVGRVPAASPTVGAADWASWIAAALVAAFAAAALARRFADRLSVAGGSAAAVAAAARGLSRHAILLRHVLRAAVPGLIADVSALLPRLVSAAVAVAMILSLPTAGGRLLDALRAGDMGSATALLFLLACLSAIAQTLADMLRAMLDRRFAAEVEVGR